MSLWRVIFTFLSVFILAASCRRPPDFRQPGIAINTLAQNLHTNIAAPLDGTNNGGEKPLKYTYTYTNGRWACTLANMAITIRVPYEKKDNKTELIPLTVPSGATVTGTCSRILSEMTLTWQQPPEKARNASDPSKEENKSNTIRFTFLNDHTSFSLFSIDINIYLDNKNFPDKKTDTDVWYNKTSESDLRLFTADLIKGIHQCDKKTKIKVSEAEVVIKDVKLIAFNNDENGDSRDKVEQCDGKENPKTFNYVGKNEKGESCFLAKMSISLNIFYETKDNKKANKTINASNDAVGRATCETSSTSTLQLTWKPKGEAKSENEIRFQFIKEGTRAHLRQINYNIILDNETFPNSAEKIKKGYEDYNLFAASSENGMYSCADEISINVDDIEIIVKDVLLVAFDAQKDFNAKRVTDCSMSSFEDFKYIVQDKDKGKPCILADMAIGISVKYETKEAKEEIQQIDVGSTVNVAGKCGSETSGMRITWGTNSANNITFLIYRGATSFYVYEIHAKIYLDETNFPNAKYPNTEVKGRTEANAFSAFKADAKDGYYKCKNQDETVNIDKITLHMKDVFFVAFNTADDLYSKKVTECAKSPESSTPSPTASPPPGLDPSFNDYKYVITDKKDSTKACIAANMKVSVTIPSEKDGKEQENTISVPDNATVTGDCESSTMILTWPGTTTSAQDTKNSITLTFNKTESEYFLDGICISVPLNGNKFSDAIPCPTASKWDLHMFSTPLNHLYKCDDEATIEANSTKIKISDTALVAFNTEKSLQKIEVNNCHGEEPEEPEEASYAGAIAGGVIGGIAALGLIIFLAVMCKRRVNTNRSYR